jgi:hypothetical protein
MAGGGLVLWTGQVPMEDEEGTVVYELMASVAHIRDAKTDGNLVAHIKVAKPYHKLKEGISHIKW